MNIETNFKTLIIKNPLKLDCGKTIKDFPIAYETYGSLNSQKDNAILVFHALTGDQYVSGINPVTKIDGWWSYAVGPGKAIDTNKYFVICIYSFTRTYSVTPPTIFFSYRICTRYILITC